MRFVQRIGQLVLPKPKLQPDGDFQCVILVHIKGNALSWMTIPCDERVTCYWICESKTTIVNPHHNFIYTPIVCCDQCLIISNLCFVIHIELNENDLMIYSSTYVDMNYISQLLHALSMHDLGRRYLYHGKDSNSLVKSDIVKKVFSDQLKNQDNIRRPVTDMELVLKLDGNKTILCGPNMKKCHDGTCAILSNLCVSDFTCFPSLCTCRKDQVNINDPMYCRTKCNSPACSCQPLMFQCSVGGCVPYSFVCDGQPQCDDSSDEFCTNESTLVKKQIQPKLSVKKVYSFVIGSEKCMGFRCLDASCIHHRSVDDLIPDCIEAEDEQHGLNIKHKGAIYECTDKQEIHCMPDHSKCFNIHKMCFYDLDEFGHVAYCRSGSHLFMCTWIECTNSFKCPHSYCIPIRMVCNGYKDCIDGEDEDGCENNVCLGYLKCSGTEICIHPFEVCDGVQHCPKADDEAMCDVKECPVGCQCGGYSAICRDENLRYIPTIQTENMKYLSLQYRYMLTPDFSNLTFLSELIILDLAHAGIRDICLAFQTYLRFYDTLVVLYLQYNDIMVISSECFKHLNALAVLHLQGNHLSLISDSAFSGLFLNFLMLGRIALSNISEEAFFGVHGLGWVDMAQVQLDYASNGLLRALSQVHTISTQDDRLCCVVDNAHCFHDVIFTSPCLRMLSHASISPLLALIGVGIVLINILSIWPNHSVFFKNRPVQYMLNYILISGGVLCGLYVIVIATADIYYEERYVINAIYWESSFICRGQFVIISTGLYFLIISIVLLQHISYKAIIDIVFSEQDVKVLVVKVLFCTSFPMTANSLIFVYLQSDLHRLCSDLNQKQSRLSTILSSLPLVLIMLLVLIHFIYTKTRMFKHTYKITKDLMTLSSSDLAHYKQRINAMLKTTVQSFIATILECLPIPCTFLLGVCDIYSSPLMKIIALMMPVIVASTWHLYLFIWQAFLRSRWLIVWNSISWRWMPYMHKAK